MPEKGLYRDRETAEMLAVNALTYLAHEPEALGRFLALAGLGPATLRSAASDPRFLAGVLDFFLGDEKLLIAYAGTAGIEPRALAAARRTLSDSAET